jgi:hypothetical protein
LPPGGRFSNIPTSAMQTVACNYKMTFRSLFILIFCVTRLTVFSQCIDREKITYGGDWGFVDFIHRYPTYNFTFGGDTSKNWNVLDDPIDIVQAPAKVLSLKKVVDNKIKEFAGEKFYSKVTFNSVEVVYADRLKAFIDSGRQDVTLKYCKAKYFFYYEFKPDTIATFHIGIALDKNGNILSEFNFPTKNNYKSIDTTFTYCKLVEVARQVQRNIDPIKEIKLEYNSKTKRFYWLISQGLVNEKEGLNYFNQVYIDANNLTKATTSKASVSVIY